MAGAKPNVMSSASESNCKPKGLDTFSSRALMPSNKSKTAPAISRKKAYTNWCCVANTTAALPHSRLQQVIVLGMCFFISISLYVTTVLLYFLPYSSSKRLYAKNVTNRVAALQAITIQKNAL